MRRRDPLSGSPQFAQERAFPRVQYPSHLRPYLVVGGEKLHAAQWRHPELDAGAAKLVAGEALLDDPVALVELAKRRRCFGLQHAGPARRAAHAEAIGFEQHHLDAARGKGVGGAAAGEAAADNYDRDG